MKITENTTIRDFLQVVGTECLRDTLHKNIHVISLMSGYKRQPHNGPTRDMKYPLWIISDTRFPNELKAVKDKNGITIRVNRPGLKSTDLHPSETALDNVEYDYVIDNDGTIQELEDKVRQILLKEGILPSLSRSIK